LVFLIVVIILLLGRYYTYVGDNENNKLSGNDEVEFNEINKGNEKSNDNNKDNFNKAPKVKRYMNFVKGRKWQYFKFIGEKKKILKIIMKILIINIPSSNYRNSLNKNYNKKYSKIIQLSILQYQYH